MAIGRSPGAGIRPKGRLRSARQSPEYWMRERNAVPSVPLAAAAGSCRSPAAPRLAEQDDLRQPVARTEIDQGDAPGHRRGQGDLGVVAQAEQRRALFDLSALGD